MNTREAGLVVAAAIDKLGDDEVVKLVRLMRRRYNYSLTEKPKAARNILISSQPMHCYTILCGLANCSELVPAQTIIDSFPLIKKKLATVHLAPLSPRKPQKAAANKNKQKSHAPKSVGQNEARKRLFDFYTDEELWKIFLLVARDNPDLKPTYLSPASLRTREQRKVGTITLYRSLSILLGLSPDQMEYATIIAGFARIRKRLAQLLESQINDGRQLPWLSADTLPLMPEDLALSHAQLGEIVATQHAWMCFCKRYCHVMNRQPRFHDGSQVEMQQELTALLAGAELEAVEPGIRVIRIINNDFKPAYYLRARSHNLRFVISETDTSNPKPLLLTVEIAVRGTKFVPAVVK